MKRYPETWEQVRAKMQKGYLLHTWHRTVPPNIWIEHQNTKNTYNFEWRDAPINWNEVELISQGEDIIAPSAFTLRMVNHGPDEKIYRLKKVRRTSTSTKK